MRFARYQAWESSPRLQVHLKHVFERVLGEEDAYHHNVVNSQWTPRVDIREEDKHFVILVDIPGVDPNGIEISMDKGILSIKGERKAESVETTGKLTSSERSYGAFYRRFALPDSADVNGISAVGKLGVLQISIPKKPETMPRRITISH